VPAHTTSPTTHASSPKNCWYVACRGLPAGLLAPRHNPDYGAQEFAPDQALNSEAVFTTHFSQALPASKTA
jgi:hypothetical protein